MKCHEYELNQCDYHSGKINHLACLYHLTTNRYESINIKATKKYLGMLLHIYPLDNNIFEKKAVRDTFNFWCKKLRSEKRLSKWT